MQAQVSLSERVRGFKQGLKFDAKSKSNLKITLIIVNSLQTLLLLLLAINQFWLPFFIALVLLAGQLAALTLYLKSAYEASVNVCFTILYMQIVSFAFLFGKQADFQVVLWPLACVYALNFFVSIKLACFGVLSCICGFACVYYLAPESGQYVFSSQVINFVLVISGLTLISTTARLLSSYKIARASWQKTANLDALTGLYNRRFFTEFLSYQIAGAKRDKKPFCIAITDIDHFKQINDTYGHDTGDEVLKGLAYVFEQYLARSDVICRWGGEEFLLFIPEQKIGHSLLVIEAILSVVRDTQVAGVNISLSFGLVESDGTESLEDVVGRADQLLYQAKQAGRDNVQTELKVR